jgi:serine/threonine protein kinase
VQSGNAFLSFDGVVKIGDFGIARMLSHSLDKARSVVGTAYYMSPEVSLVNFSMGALARIYALSRITST